MRHPVRLRVLLWELGHPASLLHSHDLGDPRRPLARFGIPTIWHYCWHRYQNSDARRSCTARERPVALAGLAAVFRDLGHLHGPAQLCAFPGWNSENRRSDITPCLRDPELNGGGTFSSTWLGRPAANLSGRLAWALSRKARRNRGPGCGFGGVIAQKCVFPSKASPSQTHIGQGGSCMCTFGGGNGPRRGALPAKEGWPEPTQQSTLSAGGREALSGPKPRWKPDIRCWPTAKLPLVQHAVRASWSDAALSAALHGATQGLNRERAQRSRTWSRTMDLWVMSPTC